MNTHYTNPTGNTEYNLIIKRSFNTVHREDTPLNFKARDGIQIIECAIRFL